MTKDMAKRNLSFHSGRSSDFENWEKGYVCTLRYNITDIQQQEQNFNEIISCLKILEHEFYEPKIDVNLMADLWGIQYCATVWLNQYILVDGELANNLQQTEFRLVQIWAEVLAETIVYLLEKTENPFDAYENYKYNYDIEI